MISDIQYPEKSLQKKFAHRLSVIHSTFPFVPLSLALHFLSNEEERRIVDCGFTIYPSIFVYIPFSFANYLQIKCYVCIIQTFLLFLCISSLPELFYHNLWIHQWSQHDSSQLLKLSIQHKIRNTIKHTWAYCYKWQNY